MARERFPGASLASASSPDSPLLRREVLCARPPPFRGENLMSASDYGRVSRFGVQSRLGSHAVLTSRQERFAMQLKGQLPDSRSGLIIADFAISCFLNHPISHTRTLQELYEFIDELLS